PSGRQAPRRQATGAKAAGPDRAQATSKPAAAPDQKEPLMPDPGFFVLHPAVLPPLEAGSYTLEGEIEDLPAGAVEPLAAHLTVSSPRFTMPPEQILSTYPPANAFGAFQGTLPQIVLKRRTLPWERQPDLGDPHLPWLALVVVAEGEGTLSAEAK